MIRSIRGRGKRGGLPLLLTPGIISLWLILRGSSESLRELSGPDDAGAKWKAGPAYKELLGNEQRAAISHH